MLHLSIYLFPLIAIVCGLVSLVSVVKFVKHLYEDSLKAVDDKD